jgi:hypothetical protein
VPNLRPAPPVELTAQQLAAEATDPGQLAALLDDAGFETAVVRSYAGGPAAAVRRADIRVIRFGSPAGAERYLSWLSEHASDLVGDATRSVSRGVALYLHEPTGCCAKETGVALAAWRHGREVIQVLVAGPGADDAAARRIIGPVRRWAPPR